MYGYRLGFFFLTLALILSFTARAEEKKIIPCADLQTKVYDISWLEFKANAQTEPEKALVETIDAMRKKDKPRLKELSYPASHEIFDTQASAYFSQMDERQLESTIPSKVKAYYTFENTGVFFVELINPVHKGIVDFPFYLKQDTPPAYIIDKMSVVNGPIYGPLHNWYAWDKHETPYVCQDAKKE